MQSTSQGGSEPILFTRGVPAVEALPNQLISTCLQAVLEGPDGRSILQYGHNGGYLPLRRLLSEQYAVSADQLLVGNGSLHLQDLLSALLIKPGDVVLVEQPSYDRAIKTFRRRGAKVIGIPLEHDGVNLQALEKALAQQTPAFMYIVPDFQNPAGVTTSAAKRQALVDLAARHNFWLVEDIPYRTLRYKGESIPLLRDLDDRHTITVSSFSKLISPALRVGYLVAPVELVKKLTALAEDTTLAPVLPTQAAVVEFHKRGYFASNLESLKQLYAPRLQAIVQALKTYLPNVAFAEPEGGFFVSITLPEQNDYSDLLARAKQAGLILTDGRGFFADPLDGSKNHEHLGENFVRLPFCALTPEQIEEGVRRLAAVVA
ncbi:PLP-dependent aminotransferase family protein [Ktedonosporobacter rubrisoli]|uniref:PLP-dependent aminotransferase family protein n=1 Tax=Ktedonosporobacter rubrisoli TaxID=2509675 RepID=A0A4P6JT48_KTERU|nr:PLP-dependent aminotransferase family protein [Ktedonosporobacter rubrisoli]QBD78432.1 PLP-dependent aminotransferase family protein [Ktedonosporobacter rubrisoli]